jgi:DNA-binding beta-propeller fold protein YncE
VGTNAKFGWPQGLVVAPSGNIYVADTGNNVVRAITVSGAAVTAFVGGGSTGTTSVPEVTHQEEEGQHELGR